MNIKFKNFVLIPIVLVLISGALIWVTGVWKLYQWLPLKQTLWVYQEEFNPDGEGAYSDPYNNDNIRKRQLLEFKKFLEQNPTNPEYYFGYAMICRDSLEILKYIHDSERLDPENPIYPYYLGLAYSGVYHFMRDYQQPDSALAAFSRAEKLDPDNAATDLAKLNLYIKDITDPSQYSYIQKISSTFSRKNEFLTSEGRRVIRSAMEKPYFRSYTTDAIGYSLKLLNDSGNNDFLWRRRVVAYHGVNNWKIQHGIKCYIKDIGPFNNRSLEANIDTLIALAYLGNMLQEDTTGSFIDHYFGGNLIMKDVFDILGDVYLVHEMKASERLIGLSSLILRKSRYLPMGGRRQDKTIIFDTHYIHFIFMLIYVLISYLLVLLILSFVVGLIGTLIAYKHIENIPVSRALGIAPVTAIMGSVIIYMSVPNALGERDWYGFTFAGGILLIGVLISITRLIRRRKGVEVQFAFPLFLFIAGALGMIAYFMHFRSLIMKGHPFLVAIMLGVVMGSVVASRHRAPRCAAFWGAFVRTSAICFLIISIILIICWALIGGPITRYMKLEKITPTTEIISRFYGIHDWNALSSHKPWNYGVHFIANDGSYYEARTERLKDFEEMYGVKFE